MKFDIYNERIFFCVLALLIIKEPTLTQYKSPFSSFYMYEAKILNQKINIQINASNKQNS